MDKDKNANSQAADASQQTKLLLILVLAAALITPLVSSVITVSALSAKLAGSGNSNAAEGEGKAEGQPGAGEAELPIVFYEPMEFLVNLADTEANHYLKTTVSLGSRLSPDDKGEGGKKSGHGGGHGAAAGPAGPQPAVFKTIKAREPLIRDLIISVVSAYPMAVLATVQGKRELKDALSARLQQELGASDLTVYFTSFTLQ